VTMTNTSEVQYDLELLHSQHMVFSWLTQNVPQSNRQPRILCEEVYRELACTVLQSNVLKSLIR